MPPAAEDDGGYVTRRAHPSKEPIQATAEIRIFAGTTKASTQPDSYFDLLGDSLQYVCKWLTNHGVLLN
jgi:hypothetical protein